MLRDAPSLHDAVMSLLSTLHSSSDASADVIEAAEAAGLRYVHDTDPGFARKRAGKKSFFYVDSRGKRITDAKTLERIVALRIPPAWQDVWICTRANGHLQCTGRDQRGRKQYLYHVDWRKFRDETKYTKMLSFGQKLPLIRRRLRRDLAMQGLTKEKVLASVVAIMDQAMIRVGNDEYARTNNSYGLTTMKHGHVKVTGATVKFHFRGKSGIVHDIELHDPRIAKVVKKCQDLPGQELFGYRGDDDELITINSSDVNAYVQEIAGEEFTAKDFRTWGGSVRAAECLLELGPCAGERAAKKAILQAVRETAEHLGNTVSVCRKYYVHPSILESHASGLLFKLGGKKGKTAGLKGPESFFLNLLKTCARPRRMH